MSNHDTEEDWHEWRRRRVEAVSAPHGPLALTGTHWLADAEDGRLPRVPGHWREKGDELVLTASAADGITLDGVPVSGEVRLTAGRGGLAHGERALALVRPEGEWAVRVFDPAAAARQRFAGIDAFGYDPRWALTARFEPYPRRHGVRVANADGRERGLGLDGDLVFTAAGGEHRIAVAVEADGSLWGVVADATSGSQTFRFRFLRPPAPAADGTVQLDLNRAQLPPCAFSDAFLCPFPPPGNTLPFAVEAGEKAVLTR